MAMWPFNMILIPLPIHGLKAMCFLLTITKAMGVLDFQLNWQGTMQLLDPQGLIKRDLLKFINLKMIHGKK